MHSQTDHALGALLSLPPPRIAAERLQAALATHWRLTGVLTPLGGERDLNFQLRTSAGDYLVKLAHSAESAEMTAFQSLALQHVAAQDPGLPVSRLLPCDQGLWAELPEGRLRVLSWLEGTPMHMTAGSDAQAAATGQTLARLGQALQGFAHPASDYVLLWDIKQAWRLPPLLPAISDPELRRIAADFLQHFTAEVLPRLAELPWQIAHNDFNRHNLLVAPEASDQIVGILDFGDILRTPRICDLAVAASYQIAPEQILTRLCAVVAGYTAVQPLQDGELVLLYDLILARMVASLAIGSWRAAQHPENAAYIGRNLPAAQAGLQAFCAVGRDAARHAFRSVGRTTDPSKPQSKTHSPGTSAASPAATKVSGTDERTQQ